MVVPLRRATLLEPVLETGVPLAEREVGIPLPSSGVSSALKSRKYGASPRRARGNFSGSHPSATKQATQTPH